MPKAKLLSIVKKFLLILTVLCVYSTLAFAQFDLPEYDETGEFQNFDINESDTISDSTASNTVAHKEGGSANHGINFLYYENYYNASMPNLSFIDTVSHNVHRYRPYESKDIFRSDRGNIGTLTQNLEYLFKYKSERNFGHNPYDLYRFSRNNSPFYQGRNPYAELFYVLGLSKDQYFRGLFNMNVWRGLNIGGEWRAIAAPGKYLRQRNMHNNARFSMNYISRNQRYTGLLAYYFNNIKLNENGGIDINYDSIAKYTSVNISTMPIVLSNAENAWNEHNVLLKNSYLIGWGKVDSVQKTGFNFGWISHTFNFQYSKIIYNERNITAGYYPNYYYSNSATTDTVRNMKFENLLAYSIGDVTSYDNDKVFNLFAGARHSYRKQSYDTIFASQDTSLHLGFNNVYDANELDVLAKLRFRFWKQLHISAGGSYTVLGDKNLFFDASIEWFFNTNKDKKWTSNNDRVYLEAQFIDKAPSWFQMRHLSNNYIWFNDFVNQQALHLKVGLDFWGIKFSVEHSLHNNYIYMTKDAYQQAPEMLQVSKLVFEKNFKFWLIGFDNRIVLQKVWNGDYLHLPLFLTKNALYFDFVLVKHTPTQIGVEMTYNTPYFADFYNPALQSFYPQNDFKTGNFFYVNAFINLKIKRANLFLKGENLLGRGVQKNYMQSPGYPTYALGFRFGILWRFYD